MGKIVVQMSLSLDGYMEGPNREIDWHMVDDEVHRDVNDYLRGVGVFLQGRVTHELMLDFWPTADEDPSSPAPMRDFAGIWREKPKYVFSKTFDNTDWNTTIVREVDADQIRELKAQYDVDLVLGGADLAATFMDLDLIDDYRLYIDPIVIGAGKRLFPPGFKASLALVETRSFGNGVVLVRYGRSEAR
jgi:dihydrofolate reductase